MTEPNDEEEQHEDRGDIPGEEIGSGEQGGGSHSGVNPQTPRDPESPDLQHP